MEKELSKIIDEFNEKKGLYKFKVGDRYLLATYFDYDDLSKGKLIIKEFDNSRYRRISVERIVMLKDLSDEIVNLR